MNVKYINPFITATINTFKGFLGANLKTGKPSLFNSSESDIKYDISGIIGLAGEVRGAIVISFPKLVALKIVSDFLKEDIKIFGDDVIDTIGELVNIIAGNAKKDLEEYRIVISLPSVVKGPNHQINWMQGVPVIMIPFTSNYGEVYLFVSLRDII